MTNLFIRLPNDMAERLKRIAKVRGISLNKLMFELSASIGGRRSEAAFSGCSKLRGNPKRAAQLLDELDELGF